MQIIFDSRFDGVADAHRMRDMLTAYINSREGIITNVVNACGTSPQVAQQVARAVRREEGPTLQTVTNEVRFTPVSASEDTESFTPGDLGAPSPAVAAPSPIAPEVPQDGVPMPPTVASVPAPPSTVPEAPVAPTISAESASLAGSGELDVKGLPWDERIHAGTKVKNADGSWRQRRGLNDPALLARVEAELRLRTSVGAEPAQVTIAVPTPPVSAANVPPPPVVATPPAPAAPDALTYDGFLSWVTPKMMDGSTPFDKVAAALSASGVSSLQELRDSPAAIPAVYAALGGAA